MPHSSSIPLQQEVGELGASTSTAMEDMEEHNSNLDRASKPASCPSLAQISASANTGSFEKRGMAFEEASRRPSSHLPSNMSCMSRRRATSQIASPIVDFDVAIAEKPYKKRQSSQPAEAPKCYYIINPRVPGLAWYLTKGKSNSNPHGYQVERVPTHLVHTRQNHMGYLIETDCRDEGTPAAEEWPVTWTPKCRNAWSTTAAPSAEKTAIDIVANPGKRVNRFERRDLEGDIKRLLHDESNVIVDRRDIPLITKSIIHQLHTVRPQGPQGRFCITRDCKGNDEEASSSEERDLENVIEAALLDFRRSTQSGDITEADGEGVARQSKMPARIELESESRRIKLRPSVVADPAMTLSIPQTSFTGADANRKHNVATEGWQRETPTMTTLVSPQSVTAITWTKHGGHFGEPSESPATTDSPSDENSEGTSQTRRTSSCHGHSQDRELETSQVSLGASSIASTITSFPKLLSRHCTREWIRPLANLEDLHHRTSTDLYYQGVDSRLDRPSHHHMPPNENPLPLSWASDSFWPSKASGYFTNEAPDARHSTVSQPSLTNVKSFGRQIGSAAHRRRSAPACDSKAPALQDHFLPSILGKLFVGRKKGAPGSPDSKETMDSGAKAPYNSPAHGHMPVDTPKSGHGSFTERTPAVSVEDRARIHEVLVGGAAVVDRRRRDTCSEDNRPHVCEDDIDNRVR
ncbi:hypothetical protein V8C37DRAFT_411896 [Trichoderma ceciliae]